VFHDSKELVQLEAQATEQLAAVAADRDELTRAAELLRQALVLKQQLLRDKRRPALFFVGLLNPHEKLKMDEGYEPASFFSYSETQLQLACVLTALDRPYEAEQLLGECLSTAYMLCNGSNTNVLRNLLLYGSVLDAAGDLLSRDRPQEANSMRRSADYVWRAVVAYFPQAVNDARLPRAMRDRLIWHRENGAAELSQSEISVYRSLGTSKSPVPETTFDIHAAALSQYHVGRWQEAIRHFEESAKLRQTRHFYDWLHIAMAQSHLKNRDAAQKWFDKAKEAIAEMTNPPAEVLELYTQAVEAMRNDLATATQIDTVITTHTSNRSDHDDPTGHH
jgi:tetratricopeptide (TPR) repeat protein